LHAVYLLTVKNSVVVSVEKHFSGVPLPAGEQKNIFPCCRRRQEGRKTFFRVAAAGRKAEKHFSVLLPSAGRQKNIFPCCRCRQEGRKTFFRVAAVGRRAEKHFSVLP
jgi:hypothetical protein